MANITNQKFIYYSNIPILHCNISHQSKELTMLTVIENLPAAIALTGLILRLYLGGKPTSGVSE